MYEALSIFELENQEILEFKRNFEDFRSRDAAQRDMAKSEVISDLIIRGFFLPVSNINVIFELNNYILNSVKFDTRLLMVIPSLDRTVKPSIACSFCFSK